MPCKNKQTNTESAQDAEGESHAIFKFNLDGVLHEAAQPAALLPNLAESQDAVAVEANALWVQERLGYFTVNLGYYEALSYTCMQEQVS